LERQELSSNLIVEKTIPIIVIVIVLLFWIGTDGMPFLIPLLAFIFAIYCFYNILFVVSKASYDENYLYIKKRNVNQTINLEDITAIKLSPYFGSFRNKWRIKYIENGQERSIFIFLKYGLISLKPFVKLVRTKKPSVDVVYISADIDLDW
jgi:phosphoglycerol transferase MdoB-like AlkP superfamily enzyme